MALSKSAIVTAALDILDAYGLGDLSMRRVADVLGVQAGALYYHVPNKQSLLAALCDEVLADLAMPQPSDDPTLALQRWAESIRRALLAHRDAAELVAASLAFGLGRVEPTSPVADYLDEVEWPEPDVTAATLLHFVLGHTLEEQTRMQMYALGVIDDFDAELALHRFETGVRMILTGALRPAR